MSGHHNDCPHRDLLVDTSAHARDAGFQQVRWESRLAATTPATRASGSSLDGMDPTNKALYAHLYPGPLVLPDDALSLEPDDDPQSWRMWKMLKQRNKPSAERRTIYVAGVPAITTQVSWMNKILVPALEGLDPSVTAQETLNPPRVGDVLTYLQAFYHGMEVKQFSLPVSFVAWGKTKTKTASKYVGLKMGDRSTRIRVRACPDKVFSHQLNLNDILDAAISELPDDAYAFLLMMDADMYEDDDDDFCCGRAYGGSRVAVVSSSRYHPSLDHGLIDRSHMWPASHCRAYVGSLTGERLPSKKDKFDERSPLRAAIEASKATMIPQSTNDLYGLWYSRVCRTASHELGHCFGIDHCVYYACVMQGTAGMVEDCRQPPYLCPVCNRKVAGAMMEANPIVKYEDQLKEQCNELLGFCKQWNHVGMFAGLEAWLQQFLIFQEADFRTEPTIA